MVENDDIIPIECVSDSDFLSSEYILSTVVESKVRLYLQTLSTCAFVGFIGLQHVHYNDINDISYHYEHPVSINNSGTTTTLNSNDLSMNFMDKIVMEKKLSDRVTSIETTINYIRSSIDEIKSDIKEIKNTAATKTDLKRIYWAAGITITGLSGLSWWIITHINETITILKILSKTN